MKVPDEDQPIDFSALDPARNSKRWDAMVQRTAAASLERPSAMSELWTALPKWRPALFALAALAVVTWLPWLLREEVTSTAAEPALALVHFDERHDLTAMLESADGY
ncbi:MAG: hypothetical protein QM817_37540 [Archangium sp.]